MPVYRYVHDESGDVVEIVRSMSDRIPATVRRKGRTFRRLYEAGIDAGVTQKVHGYPYLSRSIPRENVQVGERPDGSAIIEQRHRVVKSVSHERELGAELGYKRD